MKTIRKKMQQMPKVSVVIASGKTVKYFRLILLFIFDPVLLISPLCHFGTNMDKPKYCCSTFLKIISSRMSIFAP